MILGLFLGAWGCCCGGDPTICSQYTPSNAIPDRGGLNRKRQRTGNDSTFHFMYMPSFSVSSLAVHTALNGK
jgi:hypothetical protein